MTNDEIRMTKEFLSSNDEGKARKRTGKIRSFELRHSFDIRISDFDIFQSSDRSRESSDLLTPAATKL